MHNPILLAPTIKRYCNRYKNDTLCILSRKLTYKSTLIFANMNNEQRYAMTYNKTDKVIHHSTSLYFWILDSIFKIFTTPPRAWVFRRLSSALLSMYL